MMPLAINWENLHQLLRTLYEDMMPLCGNMAGVAKGVAGLGALFYIAYRVWKSLSNAEPIDVFPLLRPFVIGLCIMFFPTFVLGSIDGILKPVARATAGLVESQTFDMEAYQQQKNRLEREAMLRNPETAYLVDDAAFDKQLSDLGILDTPEIIGMYASRTAYNVKLTVREWFRDLLETIFQAASLVIDTLRTFFLIVLAIFGPLAFAISVYDGFQSTLTTWLSRYIVVYLWLPVADMFSAILARIQILMLQQDIAQLADPSYIPDGSNTVYIIFMIIGIVGYFTVPTVAGWIVQAGGAGAYGKNMNAVALKGGNIAAATTGAIAGHISGKLQGHGGEESQGAQGGA